MTLHCNDLTFSPNCSAQHKFKGYDLTIGTSERGDYNVMDPDFKVPPFQHALVLFGGVEGLEVAVGNDERLSVAAADTKRLFDM